MSIARSHFYRLAPVGILLLIALVVLMQPRQLGQTTPQSLACVDLTRGCSARMGAREVEVKVNGELKVLQPFELAVRAKGAHKVQAQFTMEGMDMGFNLYTLRPDQDGVFHGRITLPVCVTGRRDWVMTLDIDGERLAIPFVTEL